MSKITKRTILSCISQVFDPLGLVGPTVIQAKVIMQGLWQLRSGWDESLPMQTCTQWLHWVEGMQSLNTLRIARRILCDKPTRIELHGFCDASELAYGCCIYVKSSNAEGCQQMSLLCAKSRVAPLKKLSLPRLELCGASLLVKLYDQVKKSLTIDIDAVHFWSDSTITLSWICGDPSQWQTFVANRVSEIQQLAKNVSWHHVRSEQNPADIISRGVSADQLNSCKLWWNGPQFLAQDNARELHEDLPLAELDSLPEVKKRKICTVASTKEQLQIFDKFSSFVRLRRVMAYCIRFIRNLKSERENRSIGPLTVDEIQTSTKVLIKLAQKEAFAVEIDALGKSGQVARSSQLVSLNPFMTSEGVMRVGGRLVEARIEYDQRHPLILPKDHPLTTMIIRFEHLKHFHLGPNSLLAVIRMSYWPVSGKSLVKRILRNCVVCFRSNPRSPNQIMGNLSKARIEPLPPFTNTGIDYAGPFNIKISRNVSGKAYLCVFVCMSTKALHLELVSDLSTKAFLNCLKRFFARRGKSLALFSDNGKNFVGADNAIKELYSVLVKKKNEIDAFLVDQCIQWNFNPPYAPHMGGIWESAVKSCKLHLKKVIGDALLSFEELTTLLAQIESILNSRPLTPLSADPRDLLSLTPGHFLIGRPLTALPEGDVSEEKTNRLQRYHVIEQMRQRFWKRWSVEYFANLQQRTKWNQTKENVKIDDMVIIRDDSTPPMHWKLGRIVRVYPGANDNIRVVDIRTSSGIVQRAISKICLLPLEDN